MTLDDFHNLAFELYSNVSEDYANNHKADYIVLDEFHRCDVPEWGKNIKLRFEMLPSFIIFFEAILPQEINDNFENYNISPFDTDIV